MRRQPEAVVAADRAATHLLGALTRLAGLIDRRPALFLPVWILAYFTILWRVMHRPLWYDELFTYHVSMSPTFQIFIDRVRHFDLNPPLNYPFVRASIVLFGDSPFFTRLPCILAFLCGSLIVYRVIARRLGGALGLAALGIVWSFSLTSFAVDARTYGLLFGLLSLAMLCWLNAADVGRWSKWHAGLAAAVVGMLMTHCFSPVSVATLGAGELVRTIVLRRIDRRIWVVLIAPLCLVLFYIPLLRNAHTYLMPHAFDATVGSFPLFYLGMLLPVLPLIGVLLVLWLTGGNKSLPWLDLAQPHEMAFAIAAMLIPSVIISYCLWSGLAFFPRYGIGAALGGCLILTALLAKVTRRNVNASAAAAVLILILFGLTQAGTKRVAEPYENASLSYRTIRADLPFVTACGLTFLEMDHRESPGFAKRLYYLTDMESAVKYTNATVFESFPAMQRRVRIRANVSPYAEFVAHNRQFLVLARQDCPLDWLLIKLKDAGAQIRLLQDVRIGYQDRELYEVTMPVSSSRR